MTIPTTRLRVLMISDVYFPRVNGVSTSISTFRRDLDRLGCDSVLIAPRYRQELTDEPAVVRIPSRYIPFDPEDRMMKLSAAVAAGALHEARFDLVHIQTPFVAHKAGLELARLFGCRTIETYHTYFEQYFHHYVRWLPKRLLQRAARSLSRIQCNAVDRVVAPSHAMANVLRGYGVDSPVDVIPTGLDLEDFAAGDGSRFRAKHGIPVGRPLMLHVGRVAFEKNIGFIIEVLGRVRREVPDTLLVVAGEGPALDSVRRSTEALGLQDHVLFVGYLDRSRDLLDCYRSANLLVFASSTETQGLVPLEAMAVGTPVVSTAVLGTKEIVGAGRGAIAVTEDVEAFSRAAVDVLKCPVLRRELSAEARKFVDERWSSSAMAGRLLALYEDMLTDRAAVERRELMIEPAGG